MARLSKDVVVVTKPVRTFPNGDYFFMELCRKNSRYECVVQMNCASKPEDRVTVARAEGKTIRQAEESCYEIARERCPSFPKPPYFKRGERKTRVVPSFRTTATKAPGGTDIPTPKRVR